MKKIFWGSLLFLAFVFCSTKCYKKEDIENRILIENQLDYAIFVVPSYTYPDTSLLFTTKDKILANSASFEVLPKSSSRITNLSLCYESEWKRVVESDTLLLFAFNREVLKKEDWDSIVKFNKFIRRYKITWEVLMDEDCKLIIK